MKKNFRDIMVNAENQKKIDSWEGYYSIQEFSVLEKNSGASLAECFSDNCASTFPGVGEMNNWFT